MKILVLLNYYLKKTITTIITKQSHQKAGILRYRLSKNLEKFEKHEHDSMHKELEEYLVVVVVDAAFFVVGSVLIVVDFVFFCL